MTFDWTLTLGSLVNLGGLLIAALAFLVTRVRRDTILDFRLGHIEEAYKKQAAEMEKMSTTLAAMSSQDIRLCRVEEDVRLLRTGEGFVLPLKPARKDF